MKRSEAIKLVQEKLSDVGLSFKHFVPGEDHAEAIIKLLEDLGVIDSSQFGSVCSRCGRKSWDSEEEG